MQEIIELVVFALIALVVGMLVIWGVGWVFTFLGWLFRIIGAFLWTILKFVIPIAIVAGVVYLLVRLITRRNRDSGAGSSRASSTSPTAAGASGAGQSPIVIEGTDTQGSSSKNVNVIAGDTPKNVNVVSGDAAARDNAAGDAGDKQRVETRVDDAEPVDTDVDTSGFKAMDDEAEDLEDDSRS